MNSRQKFFIISGMLLIVALYIMMNSALTPSINEYNRNKSITSMPPILFERGEWQNALNNRNMLEVEIENIKSKFYFAIVVVVIISVGGVIFNNSDKIRDKSIVNGNDMKEVVETKDNSEKIKMKLKKLEELRENNLINDEEFADRKNRLISEFLE